MSASAWLYPSKSIRVIGTAGTEPGPSLPPAWSSEVMRRRPPATGRAPAASSCGLPSTSAKRSSSTERTWTVTDSAPPTGRASRPSGPPCRCSTTVPRSCPTACPATSSLRGVRHRCRPSCTSAATMAPPRSSLRLRPGCPALERGYAFAAIDGPGQGSELYYQRGAHAPRLGRRVVPGMVDVLTKHPGCSTPIGSCSSGGRSVV